MSIQGAFNNIFGESSRAIGAMKFFINEDARAAAGIVTQHIRGLNEAIESGQNWLDEKANDPEAHKAERNPITGRFKKSPYQTVVADQERDKIARSVLADQLTILRDMPARSLIGKVGKIDSALNTTDRVMKRREDELRDEMSGGVK